MPGTHRINPPIIQRVITMTAKDFEFDPAEIHAKVGQKIQLKVTSTDRIHGLRISPVPEGDKKSASPGLTFVLRRGMPEA